MIGCCVCCFHFVHLNVCLRRRTRRWCVSTFVSVFSALCWNEWCFGMVCVSFVCRTSSVVVCCARHRRTSLSNNQPIRFHRVCFIIIDVGFLFVCSNPLWICVEYRSRTSHKASRRRRRHCDNDDANRGIQPIDRHNRQVAPTQYLLDCHICKLLPVSYRIHIRATPRRRMKQSKLRIRRRRRCRPSTSRRRMAMNLLL